MSLSFKTKFDEMRQGSPASQEQAAAQPSKAYDDHYADAGNMRNLCFVWLDGKRMFLNYSYLITAEYAPEENIISLSFTTHTITLKGVNLETLFYDLMQQTARQVVCTDARYNLVGEDQLPLVNEITATKNE